MHECTDTDKLFGYLKTSNWENCSQIANNEVVEATLRLFKGVELGDLLGLLDEGDNSMETHSVKSLDNLLAMLR